MPLAPAVSQIKDTAESQQGQAQKTPHPSRRQVCDAKQKDLSGNEKPMYAYRDEHGPERIAGASESTAEDKGGGVGHYINGGHAEHKNCFRTGGIKDGLGVRGTEHIHQRLRQEGEHQHGAEGVRPGEFETG